MNANDFTYGISTACGRASAASMTSNIAVDFLRRNIGRIVRAELLVGDRLYCRTGRLAEVGANYVLLRLANPACSVMCDLGSLRFCTVLR